MSYPEGEMKPEGEKDGYGEDMSGDMSGDDMPKPPMSCGKPVCGDKPEGEMDGSGEGEKDGYGKGEKGGKSYIDDTDDDPKYLQPNPTKECSACAMKCMMGGMEKDGKGKGKGEGKDGYDMSGEYD